jgi:hypothetical protein
MIPDHFSCKFLPNEMEIQLHEPQKIKMREVENTPDPLGI